MSKKQKWILSVVLPIATVIILIAVWGITARIIDSEYVLPTPLQTLTGLGKVLSSAQFYLSLAHTLLRCFLAFACSFLLALGLALLVKKIPKAFGMINTLVGITRALPTVAIVLLLTFWVSSTVAPTIVTTLIVFPTLYTNLLNALNAVSERQLLMCKVFGVSKKDITFKVQLPQITPSALTSCGAGLSLNLKLMVSAEVLSQTARSLGYLINNAKVNYEITTMLALVCVCVFFAVIIEYVFGLIAKRVGKFL